MKLRDPHNLASNDLSELERKIQRGLALLAHNPNRHGNPFIFQILSGKPHILKNISTVATNSKAIFWGPDFLRQLDDMLTLVCLKHEGMHIYLGHCELLTSNPRIANLAQDFVVNSMIERDWRIAERISLNHVFEPDKHPLWRHPLGNPTNIQQLTDFIQSSNDELLNAIKNNTPFAPQTKRGILVDEIALSNGSINIFNTLSSLYSSINNELKKLLDQFQFDNHIHSERTKKEALDDIFRAVNFCKITRGKVPEEVEDILGELTNPKLNILNFIDYCVKSNGIGNKGKTNNTRFKRRFLNQELYYPKRSGNSTKILVLLDTSASMASSDIAAGVSELKQFVGHAEILIVPVDAQPYWDKCSKVTKNSDFPKINVVGRGGTVLTEFFQDYQKKLAHHGPFGGMIVITDGGIDEIPKELKPPFDVGWLIINGYDFKPPFGRSINLK